MKNAVALDYRENEQTYLIAMCLTAELLVTLLAEQREHICSVTHA